MPIYDVAVNKLVETKGVIYSEMVSKDIDSELSSGIVSVLELN